MEAFFAIFIFIKRIFISYTLLHSNSVDNEILYSPKKLKGLGIFRIEWEAVLQHLNVCHLLSHFENEYITATRHLDEQNTMCISKLQLNNIVDAHRKRSDELRNLFRSQIEWIGFTWQRCCTFSRLYSC